MKISSRFMGAALVLSVAASTLFLACNNSSDSNSNGDSGNGNNVRSVPSLTYSVVSEKPHDTSSFTEGLEFYKGRLLESTGNYGSSKLIEIDPASFRITRSTSLDPKYFGEGITVFRDTIYQLTWKERKALVYSATDLKKIREIPYPLEQGWGLTHNDKELIASDGSSNLYFLEPGTLRILRTQGVQDENGYVNNINELEYITGFVWANRWGNEYPYIMKIDPSNGQVVARIDLTDLIKRVQSTDRHADVLNGIAYDSTTKKVYITGKYWDRLYEVNFER